MTNSSAFNDVIQEMAQDQNLTRMKKLLVYVCTNAWESSTVRLDEFDLEQLVCDLLEVAPNLQQLKLCLNGAVKTLNKQAEYTLVANAITNHLKKLYPGYQDVSEEVSLQNHYQKIAQELESDRDQLSIKKLLYCACGNNWENNSEVLDKVHIRDLIQQLHTLAPILENLETALYSIVKTLNRQAKYTLIANKIVATFGLLYAEHPSGIQAEYIDLTQADGSSQMPTASSQPATAPKLGGNTSPRISRRSQRSTQWFELRSEIMKYTNPLRAKTLIYATLYGLDERDGPDRPDFKLSPLDELLQRLFTTYATYTDLAANLEVTAHQYPEPDQYVQAASAVARATKPFYDAGLLHDLNITQVIDESAVQAAKAAQTQVVRNQEPSSDP